MIIFSAGSSPMERYIAMARGAKTSGSPESWRRPVQRAARVGEEVKSCVVEV